MIRSDKSAALLARNSRAVSKGPPLTLLTPLTAFRYRPSASPNSTMTARHTHISKMVPWSSDFKLYTCINMIDSSDTVFFRLPPHLDIQVKPLLTLHPSFRVISHYGVGLMVDQGQDRSVPKETFKMGHRHRRDSRSRRNHAGRRY